MQVDVVPNETIEGWWVQHEIFRIDWGKWKKLAGDQQKKVLKESSDILQSWENPSATGQTALFSVVGQKGDLWFFHFRRSPEALNELQLQLRRLDVFEYLIPAHSYLSVVELGLYEMTAKLKEELSAKNLTPDSDEWKVAWREEIKRQEERMSSRLFPQIPSARNLCFYPMDKRRGETVNWYGLGLQDRQGLMRDHGMIGRKYSGRIIQVITGSIGFDDWEWGVYLFAQDPLTFKKLIYEMRFDEASRQYAMFGPFYFGLRFMAEALGDLFAGKLPKYEMGGT